MNSDEQFLQEAIDVAKESVARGGYPVGAILVLNEEVIAKGYSDGKQQCDPTMHAEIDAIRTASKKLNQRNLNNAVLYSSMEPCTMCFSASFWAYISKIVYALSREQAGAIHYMGPFSNQEMNTKLFRKRIELIHLDKLSNDSKEVVEDWQKVTDKKIASSSNPGAVGS